MNKNAQAVQREAHYGSHHEHEVSASSLQLKQQKEEAIRVQLAEFAKEFEQLKQLHKQP